MKKQLLSFLLIGVIINTYAQQNAITTPKEKSLIEQLSEDYQNRQIELKRVLAERNLQEVTIAPDGRIKQAMYVTTTGHIVYNTTYNIGAGRTLSTNKVWPGGPVNVSLTGANMPNRLGVWDGGKVLNTHQEFGGRVTVSDGGTTLSDHATHVAGTMIASGVSANAKGMAYMATLKSYDWNNDEQEMANAAAAGMLISNHSYGTISGWYQNTSQSNRWEWYGDPSISTTTDYKFGIYDNSAKAWDDIASNYPYYLICKAAGNDRGDNLTGSTWYYSNGTLGTGTPPEKDGGTSGYDCIASYATAKNILTVGAVSKIGGNTGNGWTKVSDVVMSSFSGWGPTDDGRIKPDVVSPGVGLYSSISTGNDKYASMNGTSMATPAASGSLLLVQQHYNAIYGKYMRSASLKGLAIHTADEAGTTGPDYKFGWGLLNTASCVNFINDSNNNKFEERILTNAQTQTIQFNAEAGKPIKITICWTDKSGTPVTSDKLNNTKVMLVNDLDIRLKRMSDNTIYLPYVLNPASPSSAATTGDNTRDNVEQIYLQSPTAGVYTLTISNKGTLYASTQPYSLFISNGTEKISAQFTASESTICTGKTVTFTDASTGGATSRIWYFPGGNPSTSTAISPTVTYPTAGNYAVALKVTGGLGSDSIYKSNLITVGGMALPFTETFESGSTTATSWKTTNPDNGTTWALYTTSGTTPGETSAGINLFAYSTTGQRDGLMSPPVNLTTHNNPELSFKHAYTRYGGQNKTDSLIVYASTDCGVTWMRLAAYGENGTGTFATYQTGSYTLGSQTTFSPAATSDWCGGGTGSGCKTISLSSLSNMSSVMFKFESYNNYGNNLYIDNISINGTLKKPVASFTGPTMACVNTPVTFTDNSSNMPSSWTWTISGASPVTSNSKNATVTYSNTGLYTVQLKVSNTGGSDSIIATNYINIINKPNTPNIKANGATQFCYGDSVMLSTDSTGSINWYANDTLIAQNVQSIYAKKDAVYKVALTNGTCEAFSQITINAPQKPAAPTISSSITGTQFCDGNTIVLTSSANTGNQWLKNDVEINGATGKTLNVTDSGAYSVKYTLTGCVSNESVKRTFTKLTKPTVGNITGEINPNVGVSNTYSVPALSGHSFTWVISSNGTILGGNGTNTIKARFNTNDSGFINVQSKNSTGCISDAKSIRVYALSVGLNEIENSNFKLYPNPAINELTLEIDSKEYQKGEIKIVNLIGQNVIHKAVTLNKGNNTILLNIAELNKGIYFIELSSNKTKLVRKITKE